MHEVGHAVSKVFVLGGGRAENLTVDNFRARIFLSELPALAVEHAVSETFLKDDELSMEQTLSVPSHRVTFFKNMFVNLMDFEDRKSSLDRIYKEENRYFSYWLLRTYGADKISKLQDRKYSTIDAAFVDIYGRGYKSFLNELAGHYLQHDEITQIEWMAQQEKKWHYMAKHKRIRNVAVESLLPNFISIASFDPPDDPVWIKDLRHQYSYLSFNAIETPKGRFGVVLEPTNRKVYVGRWERGNSSDDGDSTQVDRIEMVTNMII